MFYQLDDDVVSVRADDLNDNILTLGFISVSELENIYRQLDFSMQAVERCKEKSNFFSSDIEVYDRYCFVKVNIINADMLNSDRRSFAIFIKKNLLLVVNVSDSGHANRDIFLKVLSKISCESITFEKLVCSFFEGLIAGDNKALENAELEINALEKTVLKNKADRNFNMELLNMKKELLLLRGYYEQLIDISEALSENENEIFDKESLKTFHIFKDKTVRLRENVDLLRDSVVHLWDAYQAYLDMRLNQTMKVFTLVTTIFFPMTVIVGWYGMNFDFMPELHWRYGYVYVMLLSVFVVLGLYLWFKKKKWF
ncbi:MAG: hypothetical protein J1E36_06010 [Eubacterium sp.]|nr:hypothetical protein [Eubacterium sp.]